MTVLLIILAVLLGLAVLAVLLGLALLWVRAGVEAVGVDGEISVELRYGFVRVPVWPRPRHLKRAAAKPRKKPSAKAKKARKKPKYRYSLNRDELDFGELATLALTLLGEMAGRLRISGLRVRVLIGTDDAAQTGMLLGGAAAFTGMTVPFLENTFDMQDYHINVDADFEADHTEWAFTVCCSLRPLQLILVLLHHRRTLYNLYQRLIKKEEAIEHE
nr:DUF2953 domain-containing protein [uncultured Agathobaculum sp.]